MATATANAMDVDTNGTTKTKARTHSQMNGDSTKDGSYEGGHFVAKVKKIKSWKASYNWKDMHADLEKGLYAGEYGGCNCPWFGLAEMRAGVNMKDWHGKRTKDEFYVESLRKHLNNPTTQESWENIFTIDPHGITASRPTIAATSARLVIPEILPNLVRDGTIVDSEGGIKITKAGAEYVWNIPRLAERIGKSEADVRAQLFKYTHNEEINDPKKKAYLPPIGGYTIYFFGDPSKLSDQSTEVAVRVHDECNGSDVFGTDICTCRPYLIFAVENCVQVAQRGGVGIIVYFRKEGRSLGEVIKYRVYNARKNQEGGDRPEKYFFQTRSIAGIEDARFQEMMPDPLLWCGIKRIDWLFSMSSEKYDAIVGAGINVMQRVALPDSYVPKGASVEIVAKIAAGYHTDNVETKDVLCELRKLETIRSRCSQIYDLATKGKTKHFRLNLANLPGCVKRVVECIDKNHPSLDIPYHSRLRHFEVQGMDRIPKLAAQWPVSKEEKYRRLLDLTTVSVLLDAGAGPGWTYTDDQGRQFGRSEGLAVASLEMFLDGMFSSDTAVPHRVNGHGLRRLTAQQLKKGFQATTANPMVGLEGRCGLLQRLGKALMTNPEFFGDEVQRPGKILDYLLKHAKNGRVSIRVLWKAVIEGFQSIWPSTASGVRRGDVWVYTPLRAIGEPGSDMVPFHKLSQWLTYSLLEPLEEYGLKFDDVDLMTPLAEYRNGGLLVDAGVLEPKSKTFNKRSYHAGSELVVEWRALTICLIDQIAKSVRKHYGKTEEQMSLQRVLEGGTWLAGRIIAKEKRPDTCSPPIKIRSDGTVF